MEISGLSTPSFKSLTMPLIIGSQSIIIISPSWIYLNLYPLFTLHPLSRTRAKLVVRGALLIIFSNLIAASPSYLAKSQTPISEETPSNSLPALEVNGVFILLSIICPNISLRGHFLPVIADEATEDAMSEEVQSPPGEANLSFPYIE